MNINVFNHIIFTIISLIDELIFLLSNTIYIIMSHINNIHNEDMRNPISKKMKNPFLRVNRQYVLHEASRKPLSSSNLIRSKYFNHDQNQQKHQPSIPNNNTSKQKHLFMTPNNNNDSFQGLEAVSVSKQLFRKKSQLILLNLKYIQLKQKYGNALLNVSKVSNNTPLLFELQDISNISEKRSQTSSKSIEKLSGLRSRLAKIQFSQLFKRIDSRKNLSRSKSSMRLNQ